MQRKKKKKKKKKDKKKTKQEPADARFPGEKGVSLLLRRGGQFLKAGPFYP